MIFSQTYAERHSDQWWQLSCPSAGSYKYTAHLLELDRCRPVAARPVPTSISLVKSPLTDCLGEWRERLRTHPDQQFAGYILSGLESGFRVGFNYHHELLPAKHNMPSALEHSEVVEHYLGEERAAGRILGLLDKNRSPRLQVNRFGVIPKGRASGKWRLIRDLSFPDGGSVNDGISPLLCTLTYTSVERTSSAQGPC